MKSRHINGDEGLQTLVQKIWLSHQCITLLKNWSWKGHEWSRYDMPLVLNMLQRRPSRYSVPLRHERLRLASKCIRVELLPISLRPGVRDLRRDSTRCSLCINHTCAEKYYHKLEVLDEANTGDIETTSLQVMRISPPWP